MTTFIGISIPIFRSIVFWQVNERVQEDLLEEVEEFEEYWQEQTEQQTIIADNLGFLLNEFLKVKTPEDDSFLITIIAGQFYQSSPVALPPPLQPDSELMNMWRKLHVKEDGVLKTSDPEIGNITYYVRPIAIEGKVAGVFVAAHAGSGEIDEAIEVVRIFIYVLLTVLGIALSITWLVSGRILAPLGALTKAVSSISHDSDLTRRVPVAGNGEIVELARNFNNMMERLENAFQSQQEFLNNAGHQLRTPITIVRGHLELMGLDPEEQEETVALVTEELDRMSRLVNDLIFLAKSERPDFLHLEKVEIGALMEKVYEKAKVLASRQWKLESGIRGFLQLDPQRITEAMMNLVENAIKHTQNGDRLAVGFTVNRNNAYLWVSDAGEGIPENEQKQIFQRFVRGTNSRRRSEGSGLGLSIVEAIVQAHNGSMNLVSKVGVGSIFTAILPIQ